MHLILSRALDNDLKYHAVSTVSGHDHGLRNVLIKFFIFSITVVKDPYFS